MTIAGTATASSKNGAVPHDVRVAVLFKVLTYDKNLKTRSLGKVRIGIVSLQENARSQSDARKMMQAIHASPNRTIKGLPILATSIVLPNAEDLAQQIDKHDLNHVYLSPGLDAILPAVLVTARRESIPLLTGEETYVRAGAALGVVLRNNRPRILIHAEGAKAQGAQFDARVLRLADVLQ
jgi:hypothetical protein